MLRLSHYIERRDDDNAVEFRDIYHRGCDNHWRNSFASLRGDEWDFDNPILTCNRCNEQIGIEGEGHTGFIFRG